MAAGAVRQDRRQIRILSPAVSRRIAAGEVIERPASAIRELMENSVDAGASSISVQIEGGGTDLIRVTDDGCGMDRCDLEVLASPHATSKIREEADLLSVATLGFRGEAMSSLAAVADLEVLSSTDGHEAWRHSSRPGRESSVLPAAGRRGTVVEARRIFENFPARKRFLKQARTETMMSTQTFIDRALPHPGLFFKLSVDGKPRLTLPPTTQKARVLSGMEVEEPESFFHELSGTGSGLSWTIILGGPEVSRPDRRHIQAFVNGRRVQDFSLQKALEIGYQGYLPGGIYPFAFAFIRIDPSLVDFNIHPAKKEVRFRDPRAVQSAIISAVRDGLKSIMGRGEAFHPGFRQASVPEGPGPSAGLFADAVQVDPLRSAPAFVAAEAASPLSIPAGPGVAERRTPFTLIGQVLGTFILAETGDGMLFVDQHAAHERMIFDRLEASPPAIQEALIPLSFQTDTEEESSFLRDSSQELLSAGYRFREEGDGRWSLLSWPAGLRKDGQDMVDEILSLRGKTGLLRSLRAMTACRSAVKDGDPLDASAMAELVSFALSAPEPRCPHGRPLFRSLSRDELFRSVQRIVG